MNQFSWIAAAAQTLCEGATLCAFVCERGGRLTAVAPMTLRESPGGTRMEALGVRELYEPTDFPAEDPADCEAIAQALAATRKPVSLERIPLDSPWIPALRRAYQGRALLRVAPAHASPFIALDRSWVDPERRFNAGRRSDIRRARRHAQSIGEISLRVFAPRTPQQLAPLLAEAFEVEASCWKGGQGSALAHDRLRGTFFRRYAEEAAAAGVLRLAFLRIGGVAAAMQLAVEAHGAFWLLKIGYDQRFARCSPGMLLMLHTVALAASKGLARYEMLGCPEPWTELWSRDAHECIALRAYPFGARGARVFAHDLARALRRRLDREEAA